MSLYLGFDLSTQQLKIVSSYEDLSFHSKYSIDFDEFSGKYGTTKGVITNSETGEVVTPVCLFIEAFQTLLDRMKNDGFPFNKVKSISGSCQQHGTVYFNKNYESLLENLSSNSNNWCDDLCNGFSFDTASNWQDRSTGEEIKAFESALGNATELCKVTGSKAHYRFSGLQIRRRAKENSTNWKNTNKIGLISSFLDSLLIGKLRGIEIGEACGTNLFDIQKNDWNNELLSLLLMKNVKVDENVTMDEQSKASELARQMIGEVVKPDNKGFISDYLIKRYGFNSDCVIWPITGDNLATIMSLPLNKDDLLVSMGTSTTVLLLTEKYVPSINYHLFKHPVCSNIYMGMLCYCNGALAREQIRNEINNKCETDGWDKFNAVLINQYENKHNHESDNKIGIYFPLGEIIPNAKSCKRRFKYLNGELIELNKGEYSIEEETLLIIESQALSCRLRVCPMLSEKYKGDEQNEIIEESIKQLKSIVGDELIVDNVSYSIEEFIKRPNNVYYVGGSSKNQSITKIYNEILSPSNKGYRVEIGDACALGGCYRAIWGSTEKELGFEEWITKKFDFNESLEIIESNNSIEKWSEYSTKVGVLSLVEKELEV